MEENWKTCSRFPKYKISSDGRLYSVKSDKILKGYKNTNGYIRYVLRKDKKTYYVYAHQLVARVYVDNPDNKPQVNHKDGNKLNNHYNNLEWCTMSENILHGNDSGLIDNAGQNNGMSKIKDSDADEIRRLYKTERFRQIDLANKFGVSRTSVSNILNNKSYTHA